MSFNLIKEQWIPVIREDDTRSVIAPWEVTEDIESNPIIALDAPRSDFNGALIQFLIGLVQTSMPPKKDKDWRKGLVDPPSGDVLRDAFEKVSHSFDFDGNGPRFMQDFDLREGKDIQIDKLLVEMPGENTIKNNTDHFLKRNTVKKMCMTCCAMALFTLQTNAPSGGQGNRTSLRGGGPLTTIVMGDNLWQTIWLNIINESDFLEKCRNASKTDNADIFPWMGVTRTSEKKQKTTPVDTHPAQVFWGMPRRIYVNFDDVKEGRCDVCGCEGDKLITKYISKNYGINYEGAWFHTLSPYVKNKNNEYLPQHAQPGGITYRHWMGLMQNDIERGYQMAMVVQTFNERQDYSDIHEVLKHKPKLWAFGYDFDNMKARCWYEGKMPLIRVQEDIRDAYEETNDKLIKTAELVSNNVRNQIKKAMFKDAKGDFSFIDSIFWHSTEPDFYLTLNKLHKAMIDGENVVDIKLQWLKTLSKNGEILFDTYTQSNQLWNSDPKRIALARRDMRKFNSKNNKKIQELLGISIKKNTE